MSLKTARPAILFLLLTILLFSTGAATSSYQYTRLGDKADSTATPVAGTAMMGGGKDLDEAFRWLCKKANGGDFLALRARGDDDYNSYVNGMCKVNSVATLIIPHLAAAQDSAVADIIRHAEAVFIAGGNQARYVEFWKGTPVEDAINANIASGKPIGGTSAGLAVLAEFAYGCLKDKEDDNDLASTDVLPNPYHERVTLVRDFLKVPYLENTLTDSHFALQGNGGSSQLHADGAHGTPTRSRKRCSRRFQVGPGCDQRQFNIQNSYDPAAERSNSDSDIRNRFTFALTYELPSKSGFAQMLGMSTASLPLRAAHRFSSTTASTISAAPVNLMTTGISPAIPTTFIGQEPLPSPTSPPTALPSIPTMNT
jgi:putative intracellular protease/amidase